MEKVRTRFAPSPTGFLHVGGVRTALFAWLVAKQAGGDFILRIEDTDKSREVAQSEKHITESLQWLGLKWDGGPYRQSERLDIYKQWGQKLAAAGRAYGDPHSPEQLEELRRAATAQKKPFLFRDHRPAELPEWNGSIPLRFKSEPKEYKWHDEVLGKLATGPEAVDDFILIKSDGFPTYNFAHIIDDHLMKVSHVIRSQEFLPSVPKFLNLYEALAIERPKLATLPYVMGPDGKRKLSKRDGAKDVMDYKKLGYLPEALINFLATLGWNDGTEQEIFSLDELIKKFSLERVHRGGASFDEDRLSWMNGHYIRSLESGDLFELARPYWPPEASDFAFEYKVQVLKLVQERLKYLAELAEHTDFFFTKKFQPNKELIKSTANSMGNAKEVLKKVYEELEQSDFTPGDIEKRLRKLVALLKTTPRELFGLIRVSVTRKMIAPGLWETLSVLDKEESLKRLASSISCLEK